jgi:hypothetical protein
MNAFTPGSNYGEFAIVKPLEFEGFGFPSRVNPVEFDGIIEGSRVHDTPKARLALLAYTSQERRLRLLWTEGTGVSDSANVPRPAASSLISLRHPPQRSRQRRRWFARVENPLWIRLAGRSAQRHKGGGRRPGDSRGAECPASLILPPSSTSLTCNHFGKDQ